MVLPHALRRRRASALYTSEPPGPEAPTWAGLLQASRCAPISPSDLAALAAGELAIETGPAG